MDKYNKIKVLTFATGNFIDSAKKLIAQVNSIGIKDAKLLFDEDLSKEFKEEHQYLFRHKKGYGYYIWKPYIIIEELKKLKDDEILVYIDATDFPSASFFDHVLEHFKTNDMMLVNRGYGPHGLWTKRDTFVLMGCDNEDYWNKTQLEAGLICLRNNQFNIDFMNEWFSFCKNEQIISNSENQSGLSNLDGFIDHRQDQSILTNLQIKHNLPHQRLSHDMVFWNYNQPLFF
jgi:hypothetical protein